MTSRLNTRSLVTAVASNGSGSTLQPLFRLFTVIYELNWIGLTLSVLAAGLIRVVMSWFPDFWSFSALTLERSWSRYTWRCCGFGDVLFLLLLLLSLLLSWKLLLSSQLCLCSWKSQQGLHPTSPDPEVCWRHFSWISNCPMQPVRACWSHSFCLELKVNFVSPPNELVQIL